KQGYRLKDKRDIIAVPFRTGVKVALILEADLAALPPRSIEIVVSNTNPNAKNAQGVQINESHYERAPEPGGKTRITFDAADLLSQLSSGPNRNLLQARVKVTWSDAAREAKTEKPLFLVRQKLIVFLPGVLGSELALSDKPDEK